MGSKLSQTPSAIAARERRFFRKIDREEREWNAEIKKLMDAGMSFNDAWCAAGGQIWPLEIEEMCN